MIKIYNNQYSPLSFGDRFPIGRGRRRHFQIDLSKTTTDRPTQSVRYRNRNRFPNKTRMTNEISMCQNFEVNRIKEIATKLERKLLLLIFVSFYFFFFLKWKCSNVGRTTNVDLSAKNPSLPKTILKKNLPKHIFKDKEKKPWRLEFIQGICNRGNSVRTAGIFFVWCHHGKKDKLAICVRYLWSEIFFNCTSKCLYLSNDVLAGSTSETKLQRFLLNCIGYEILVVCILCMRWETYTAPAPVPSMPVRNQLKSIKQNGLA